MTFIHELSSWPDFAWDSEALSAPLAAVRHKQGRHLGSMQALGFDHRQEASLQALTTEVVGTSAIEGEKLNPDEVRSSLATRLGLDAGGLPKAGREVDGIVEVMLDATREFRSPLTRDRLFDWHATLFPTGRSGMKRITVGAWRPPEAGPMQVVSGPTGRERVHFEAPDASRLESEMSRFMAWFNAPPPLDPVLKAGVAHLWVVTIHPFEDGNGRIARAIADMALLQADGSKERFYSLSARVEAERKEYYRRLKKRNAVIWISLIGCGGISTALIARSTMPTRRLPPCCTRRDSGSGSTSVRSTNGNDLRSIACSPTSRGS